ncbi:MAG: hypothetical protein NTW14_03495 [bacterium]|nr:hypothetical protein [bacterium]
MKKDKKQIKTTRQKPEFALTIKKLNFEAIRDGIPNLPESALRRMAILWLHSESAMLMPREELQPKMIEALQNPEKISHILDRLPKRSCDLLYYIFSEGGTLSFKEMETGFPLDEGEKVEQIIEPLIHRGLVWECHQSSKGEVSVSLHLLEPCAEKLQLPSYLAGKYGSVLSHRSKDQQHNLVKLLGGDPKKMGRDRTLIPWLKAELLNASHLRRFFDSLAPEDRKLLKILALHPEGLTHQELNHELSLFNDDDDETVLNESLHRLKDELGLVCTIISEMEVGRKRHKLSLYVLPREMTFLVRTNFREKYRDVRPSITVFKAPDEDFALGSRGKERPTLWIDFHQLLNHLVRCEVGVIRKGGMHKKNLKRILDRLEGQPVDSYHYLDFLFLYAYGKDIFYPDGERWRININQLLPVQDVSVFYRDFWTFYRQNGSWNDRDSSPLQGVLQKGDTPQVFSLRRAILRLICDCPIGEWVEMKVFFDELCDREMAFRSGPPPGLTNDPIKEKYRFMKATLERSLNWIGIVDTTTIANRRLDLFKLTDSGAWLLGLQPDISPFPKHDNPDRLIMHPNMEIIVTESFPLDRQLYLARFTDDQKGRVVLNRAAIRRGLEENVSIKQMIDFLHENIQNNLPPNATHLLEEMSEKSGHVYVGGEPIRLEVSDQLLMDKILHQKHLIPYIAERESAKKALLHDGTDLPKFIEELRRAGYSPRQL